LPDDTLKEFDLIRWIRNAAPADELVRVGIGDDAAVVANRTDSSLVTTDMLVDGTHFDLATASPRDVGWKSIACSVSDIAAMGGRCSVAVMSAALPHGFAASQAEALVRGALACAAEFDVRLVGGDVTGTHGPLAINVTMLGDTAGLPPILRSGAKPGDAVLVTGTLGGSRLGRQLCFRPRLAEGFTLNEKWHPHAMLDISDGLAIDLHHILEESGVGVVVRADCVPVSDDAHGAAKASGRAPLDHALGDGEDYELLFTIDPEAGTELVRQQPFDIPVTRIGDITESGARLVMPDGSEVPLERKGWEHVT